MPLEDALKEFLYECELRKFTWKTVKSYRNGLEYLINYLKQEQNVECVENIESRHLKAFFRYQQKKGRKETYLNGLIKVYRAFFKYLIEGEYLAVNPILKVNWMKEPKTIIKTFSDDEVRRMLNVYCERDYLSVRNRAIIAMLFDTGIRNYELCTLPESNIKDNYIVIFGKGKKERQVGKSPYLSKILMKYERTKKGYFEHKNIKNDNYFLSRTGRPLTTEAVERVVTIVAKIAEVSDSVRASPHTCRHTFAQMQLRNGIDVYQLSRLMGHENIRITQRYLEGLQDAQIVTESIRTSEEYQGDPDLVSGELGNFIIGIQG